MNYKTCEDFRNYRGSLCGVFFIDYMEAFYSGQVDKNQGTE